MKFTHTTQKINQNHYRSHSCGDINIHLEGAIVTISGWIHRKRDHGGVVFLDIRDESGIVQCVVPSENHDVEKIKDTSLESVVTIIGNVVKRHSDTVNIHMSTGEIEIVVNSFTLLSSAAILPFSINTEDNAPEDLRLKYRFLDLRRDWVHDNIVLRSQVISFIRNRMIQEGFTELQTPVLTASSPEGARDYLVPSRLHKGMFYALPQAPQQFKQLFMASGFNRYFQIAPCFRDEDSRADRAPGEFYQLDLEMSFVTQDDIFNTIEPIIYDIFTTFSHKSVSKPFRKIKYDDALSIYGSDKPDLRNPLKICDVSDVFSTSNFDLFAKAVQNGDKVKCICVDEKYIKNVTAEDTLPRKFFDNLNEWAREQGMGGLGYIVFGNDIKGPIASKLNDNELAQLRSTLAYETGNTNGIIFFICGKNNLSLLKICGNVRTKLANEFNLIDSNVFDFCWIIDFPFYEEDENGKIEFSHNPFSMPQGGMDALLNQDPLSIKAYQYDICCNGVELSSGAIRNHSPEIMYKAFEIAGYTKEHVDSKFGAMINAFKYGVPPHGGIAPGIDRIIMLLTDSSNLREVIAFPLNQSAKDLMMNAPTEVTTEALKVLGLKLL